MTRREGPMFGGVAAEQLARAASGAYGDPGLWTRPDGDDTATYTHSRESRESREIPSQGWVPSRESRETARESRETSHWWDSSITADVLDRMEFPPLTYLVDGVLAAGCLTTLGGAPKAGKSVLAIGLGLGVAQGGRALGSLPCEQTDVLMIALDDTSRARMQRRLLDVNAGEPLPRSLTVHTDPIGQGEQAAENLDDYLTAHHDCGLVVLDTVEQLRPLPRRGQSPYSADVAFMATLRQVLRDRVAILGLSHARKAMREAGSEDDPISAITGTHGLTGGADAVMVLTGGRGTPLRTLSLVSRDAEDSRLVLRWSPAGLLTTEHDPDDPTVTMTPDNARVFRAATEFPSGVTAADLGPVLPGVENIGNRLAGLARAGLLVRGGRGVYRVP